jgi:hypothetical protein
MAIKVATLKEREDMLRTVDGLNEPAKRWFEYKGYIIRKVVDGEKQMEITEEGWRYLYRITTRI